MTDKKLTQLPAGTAVQPTDLFYSAQDAGGGLFNSVRQPWSALMSAAGSGGAQRFVTGSFTVSTTDGFINCNIPSGAPTATLPTASSRNGLSLAIKDIGGNFAAHPLTINAAGGDTIDGLSSVQMNMNRQFMRLRPLNDGTNNGWVIEG